MINLNIMKLKARKISHSVLPSQLEDTNQKEKSVHLEYYYKITLKNDLNATIE